jgi:hypothetical protein
VININELCIHQLIDLNRRVIERIKYLQRAKVTELMESYDYGDEVYFHDKDQNIIHGKVIRFNQKSITIKENCGMEWRVSPSFVKKSPTGVISITNH